MNRREKKCQPLFFSIYYNMVMQDSSTQIFISLNVPLTIIARKKITIIIINIITIITIILLCTRAERWRTIISITGNNVFKFVWKQGFYNKNKNKNKNKNNNNNYYYIA